MRVLSLALVLSLGLAGCFSAPRMAPPAESIAGPLAPVPTSDEAVVAPLAFSASDYKGCLVVGKLKCKEMVPVVLTAFLVRAGGHTLLIDAGLGADVDAWIAQFPKWQQKLLSIEPTTSLGPELKRFGVPEADVEAILLTHTHYDHVGGLTDLSVAQVYLPLDELNFVASIDKDVSHGTLPAYFSLKQVTMHSYIFDGPAVGSFASSHDVFGDGSVIALPVPGHTPGSAAVLLPNVGGRPVLFVGDLVWNRLGLELPSHKSRLASRSVDWDREPLADSLHRVRRWMQEDPDLLVVPSHDILAWKELEELSAPWVLSPGSP